MTGLLSIFDHLVSGMSLKAYVSQFGTGSLFETHLDTGTWNTTAHPAQGGTPGARATMCNSTCNHVQKHVGLNHTAL